MSDSTEYYDLRPQIPGFTPPRDALPENRYVLGALARHKQEGLEMAVRARTVAMFIIAIMVLFVTPWPGVLYYLALIGVYILIGLAQRRYGRVGQNVPELVLLFCDLALMVVVCVVPNPFDDRTWPLAFQYQFDNFYYFFVILAFATLSYSWRTIIAVGTWTFALWMLTLLAVAYLTEAPGAARDAVFALYPDADPMAYFLDPTNVSTPQRIQEAVIFLIVAVTIALSVRRFNMLTLSQAEVERERANLARYFSPNVVEQLSTNDEPLKQVREQNIAVLFVDIVGFTGFAADRSPQDVIETLRAFHARMEAEVFAQDGTLDKYMGDGLMATFGTPVSVGQDALRAVRAARAMAASIDAWNVERQEHGAPPIRTSFGVHFGPAVLGDIGANRLEFAVIGATVNLASRLEGLTRTLDATIVISEAAMAELQADGAEAAAERTGWEHIPDQVIRGLDERIAVWAWR